MRLLFPMIVLLAAGCGSSVDEAQVDAVLALEGDAVNGKALYDGNCTGCHAADGSGDSGPSLIEHVPHHDDRDLVEALLKGPFSMPSYADWPDQDLADMLAHLRDAHGEFDGDHDH